jgi:flavin reductase (DIM6/NTAB) family NADH-FMN oxidoreductase RutF
METTGVEADMPNGSDGEGGAGGGSFVDLSLDTPVWERFFTVAPLVVVGTREGDGFDLAPKHMATPMGWRNHFGFVCTRRHSTYRNVEEHEAFTVSFPRPSEVVTASLTASPRDEEGRVPALDSLPTEPARSIDGVYLKDSQAVLECELDRIVEDFDEYGLVVGRIVEARVREEALRVTDRPDSEVLEVMPLLAYLSPGRYAEISSGYTFPLPAGFEV